MACPAHVDLIGPAERRQQKIGGEDKMLEEAGGKRETLNIDSRISSIYHIRKKSAPQSRRVPSRPLPASLSGVVPWKVVY